MSLHAHGSLWISRLSKHFFEAKNNTYALSGVIAAISGVGVFNFEFWRDDRAWNGGAPSGDDVLWFLRAR
jgi:hypothetical protein